MAIWDLGWAWKTVMLWIKRWKNDSCNLILFHVRILSLIPWIFYWNIDWVIHWPNRNTSYSIYNNCLVLIWKNVWLINGCSLGCIKKPILPYLSTHIKAKAMVFIKELLLLVVVWTSTNKFLCVCVWCVSPKKFSNVTCRHAT